MIALWRLVEIRLDVHKDGDRTVHRDGVGCQSRRTLSSCEDENCCLRSAGVDRGEMKIAARRSCSAMAEFLSKTPQVELLEGKQDILHRLSKTGEEPEVQADHEPI